MAGKKRTGQKATSEMPAKRVKPAVTAPVDDNVDGEAEAALDND
jgi:hypothetical protein